MNSPALNHIREPATKDLTKFAFWTCLQLERFVILLGTIMYNHPLMVSSDILAELDLPQSGIKDITGVGYPVGYVEQVEGPANLPDNTTMMMLFYSAQLRLRACLNEIQNNLYPPDRDRTLLLLITPNSDVSITHSVQTSSAQRILQHCATPIMAHWKIGGEYYQTP